MAKFTKEKGYLEDELKIKVYSCECPVCGKDNEIWESELILEADIENANKYCSHYVSSDREDFTFDLEAQTSSEVVSKNAKENDTEYKDIEIEEIEVDECSCTNCTCQDTGVQDIMDDRSNFVDVDTDTIPDEG